MIQQSSDPSSVLTLDIQWLAESAFCVNGEYEIVAWNAAAEQTFNLPAEQVLGQSCVEALRLAHLPPCEFCPQSRHRQSSTSSEAPRSRAPSPALPHSPHAMSEAGRIFAVSCRMQCGKLGVLHIVKAAPDATLAEVADAQLPWSVDPVRSVTSIRLTPAEHKVLLLLAAGGTTGEIANELCINTTTARNHIAHLLAKLGAGSRLEAVVRARQLAMV